MGNDFAELLDYIETKTSFPCHNYKERPLVRRIRVRMRAVGLSTFAQYRRHLESDPDEMNRLLEVITINLSYFFRNPETFDYLKNNLLPALRDNERLIFWSAGCAQGEEPYSLAIIAAEAGLLDRVAIYATDIDSEALEKAKTGSYHPYVFQYTPPAIVEKYFIKRNDDYQPIEAIRRSVRFYRLDIFDTFSYGPCDLIMCRNVLIYLDRSAQAVLLNTFHRQLKPHGYLIIGKVELLLGIPQSKRFQLVSRSEHVYKKVQDSA
jgi:chemotaxis methyl-accepting protein methylase